MSVRHWEGQQPDSTGQARWPLTCCFQRSRADSEVKCKILFSCRLSDSFCRMWSGLHWLLSQFLHSKRRLVPSSQLGRLRSRELTSNWGTFVLARCLVNILLSASGHCPNTQYHRCFTKSNILFLRSLYEKTARPLCHWPGVKLIFVLSHKKTFVWPLNPEIWQRMKDGEFSAKRKC